ncbi:hypothetical protein B0E43_09320 [Algoriphagus sp. A40]|nr:hypothetical protein B0E43_09320 [Algoriphagus sp. A40]
MSSSRNGFILPIKLHDYYSGQKRPISSLFCFVSKLRLHFKHSIQDFSKGESKMTNLAKFTLSKS